MALVLSRKESESITLTIDGVDIAVIVERIRGESVKLGIVAPKCVRIRRAELVKGDQAA